MTHTGELRATRCAICGTEGHADELYPANVDPGSLNPAVFSARRLPDRIHYRLVKCTTCGLVRSDPIADSCLVGQLYAASTFDYGDEVANLRRTYGRYLGGIAPWGAPRDSLLEIGCGNGFFLEEALAHGYQCVRGVEPSVAAVAQASPQVRPYIVCALMSPGLFEPAAFDVICLFQVFDHVPDPGALLDECFRLLKPGGLMLCLNHNIEAISARVLKERSPIIDLEHTYLYSPSTIARLFQIHGFNVRRVGSVWNTYTLRYVVRLMPLPVSVKELLLGLLKNHFLGRIRLSVPLGNLFIVAQKPCSPLLNRSADK